VQAFWAGIRYTFRANWERGMTTKIEHKDAVRGKGIFGVLREWVWFAKEDPASAFRAGVFMTFGFLALLSCLFAIAFAITTTFIQSGSRASEEKTAQNQGRRAELQRLLTSSKLGIEERAVLSNILACIDTAATPGSVPIPSPGVSRAAGTTEDAFRDAEIACAGKLVSEVAIAHGGERGQHIAWELQRLGIELPAEFR
jgi:hypothetical protein